MDIVNDLVSRLRAMNDEDGRDIDAVAKSLRCYETRLHPVLRERLTIHDQTNDDVSSLSRSTSYTYCSDSPWQGNNFMNYTLQSFFDQEEPELNQVLYVKCSKRTAYQTRPKRISMEDHIIGVLQGYYALNNRVMSLQELVTSEFGSSTSAGIFTLDYKDSSIGVGIKRFLHENDYTFPVDKFVHVAGRDEVIPTSDLVMSTRYYATRQDLRAFCKDRNVVRHLSGCCLHQLILPQNMRVRKNLHRNNIVPAIDKDKLDIFFPIEDGMCHYIIQGDVSNFTGSASNAWVMLHALALQLDVGGTWDKKPNLFGVKGSFVTASWLDVIRTYLYCTVGIRCSIEGSDETGCLPGGYLGVAANITVGLLYLTVVLKHLQIVLTQSLTQFIPKAGGDDFVVLISGTEDGCQAAINRVQEEFPAYVGFLKEFNVVRLDDLRDDEGVVDGLKFCKKRIKYEREPGFIRIVTETTIPIPETLLKTGRTEDQKKASVSWQGYHHCLSTYDSIHPDREWITGTMREYFFRIYPELYPPRVREAYFTLTDRTRLVRAGDWYTTEAVLDRVSKYPLIEVDDRFYIDTINERIHHGLKSGDLQLCTVLLSNDYERVVLTPHSKCLRRHELWNSIGFHYNQELLNQLLDINQL